MAHSRQIAILKRPYHDVRKSLFHGGKKRHAGTANGPRGFRTFTHLYASARHLIRSRIATIRPLKIRRRHAGVTRTPHESMRYRDHGRCRGHVMSEIAALQRSPAAAADTNASKPDAPCVLKTASLRRVRAVALVACRSSRTGRPRLARTVATVSLFEAQCYNRIELCRPTGRIKPKRHPTTLQNHMPRRWPRV